MNRSLLRFTAALAPRVSIARRPAVLLAAFVAITSAHATEYVVTATSALTFSPLRTVVIEGDTVRFRNGGGTHNVHADDDRFVCSINCTTNTGPSGNDWSSVVAFDQAGTIGYYCEKHGGTGGGMRGTIVVVTERILAAGFDDRRASSLPARRDFLPLPLAGEGWGEGTPVPLPVDSLIPRLLQRYG